MSAVPFASRPGFTPEQRAAFSDRGRELAVAAAAGSGKTSVLVERILQRCLGLDAAGQFAPASAVGIDHLLVVTFTIAAAEELRARLARELRRVLERTDLPAAQRDLARRQLARLPLARISTIHSFCAAVLRQYGASAGLASRRQLADHENKLLLHQLATEFLDRRLDGSDPAAMALALAWGGPDGVGQEDLSGSLRRGGGGLRDLLLGLYDFQRSLVSAEVWFAGLPLHRDLEPQACDTTHPLVATQLAELQRWASAAADATRLERADLAAAHPGVPHDELLGMRAAALDRLASAPDWASVQLWLAALYAKQNGDPGVAKLYGNPTLLGMIRRDIDKDSAWHDRVERNKDALKSEADDWQDLFGQPWAEVARTENATATYLKTLWGLATEFAAEYAAYKSAQGIQDYADLERGALRVLAAHDERGQVSSTADGQLQPSPAALALRGQLAEVLIDEYQDTNQLQDALLSLITPTVGEAEPVRQRFVVGDVKQSIYAFRLAEPALFQALCSRLATGNRQAGALQRLNRNFRSRQGMVDAINAVFTGLLTPDFGGEDYREAALEYGADYAQAFAAEGAAPQADSAAGLCCVVVERGAGQPDEADPTAAGAPAEQAAEPSDREIAGYASVAQLLQQIHASAQPILDTEAAAGSRVRPVAWRDMVILLRSTAGLATLRAVLTRAGIPHLAAARSGFYERQEIADALSLLAIIDNPLQDIPLAAALRGPAVGLDITQLLELAQTDGTEVDDSLWQRLCQRRDSAVQQDALAQQLRSFTAQLAGWRLLAQYSPLPEVLWRVYHDSGLLLAASALPGGAQRYANLLELHEQTRRFAQFDRQGLGKFIEEQRRLSLAAGDAGEPPLPGAGQDMVRIMTIHQSKGLEFPVVIVPDLQRKFNELGLRADALWDKQAGLGGIHLDLRTPDAHETRTLAWRQVQRAKRLALLEEELRLLYVALTRARERLELVAVVSADELASEPRRPERARCRLDWLRGQLSPELATAQALGADDARAADSTSPWLVRIVQASELAPLTAAERTRETSTLDAQAVQAAVERSNAPYSGAAAAAPFKQVVSDLARRGSAVAGELAAQGELELRLPLPGDEPSVPGIELIAPRLAGAQRQPGGAELGSAVHAVLHGLLRSRAFDAHCSAATVAAVIAELAAQQVFGAGVVELLEPAALAHAVVDVFARLELATAQLFSELPISLLTTLPESAEVPVIVQGTLDLLAVWPGRALVIDFKTDRRASAEALCARYAAQLEWYCRSVRELTALPRIEWVLYGLDGAGVVGPFGA